MINYFYDFVNHINKNEKVPYFIECKIKDLLCSLTLEERSDVLHHIVSSEKSSDCFRYLDKNKILGFLDMAIGGLRKIPQNKGKSKNALDHTLRVLDEVPTDLIDLKWVALFHDLGKDVSHHFYDNFNNHAIFSHNIAEKLCSLYKIQRPHKICSIVKNHMFPLDYQRNPNWTDIGVYRFIKRCGEEYALDTVRFAYYDKKAENNVVEFLKPILELEERIKKIVRKT